jgi:Transposase IS66 family
MVLPGADSIETFSLAELRDFVRTLTSEVQRLSQSHAEQGREIEQLRVENQALRSDKQMLRDEIARLKDLPPRPPTPPHKPSGMEKATEPARGKGRRRSRGAKRDRDRVTREVTIRVEAPAGARFKGYETLLVRDLMLLPEVVRYRRERWMTAEGTPIVAPLPAGLVGGYGANLRRFCLVLHAQGQVTAERLTAILTGIGVDISKRQVVRLLTANLEAFAAEDQLVLRAGLASAPFITVDDTGARHARQDAVTTQIGGDRFTVFRTGGSKSRLAFLSLLRAGHEDYVINEAALRYMRTRNLAGPVIERLATHPVRSFPNEAAWLAHLSALGLDVLDITPPPVTIASEAALWGAIRHHGLLANTVIVSDDAGQFRLGEHALCWVHAERLVHKLVPTTPEQVQAIATTRRLIWWFYRDLKAWKRDPCPRRASALRARFERLFTRKTGSVMLNRLLARLHRRKAELLRVLQHPAIPLHTNASENDIRACVTKRKISGGTMSEAGRTARDVMLGLMKTCQKLGLSFYAYLGDRFGLNTTGCAIPPLATLVAAPP